MRSSTSSRLAALALCLCLLLSGCGRSMSNALNPQFAKIIQAAAESVSSPSPTPEASSAPTDALPPVPGRETDFFGDAWHGDKAFADMEYEHYDYAVFQALADAVYDCAEKGEGPEPFRALNSAITDELYHIYTLYSIMDLRYTREQTDYTQSENLYITQAYYDANGEYWNAMHTLALSPHAELLEDCYEDWQISWFEDYDGGASDTLSELSARESELVQEYYSLSADARPDNDAICQVYIELVETRRQIARESGYSSYADYAYETVYCKDYTPEDSEALWAMAKEYFAPLAKSYADGIFRRVSPLYDSAAIDCSPEAIIDAMASILPRISSELRDAFDYMLEYGLYDIAPSPTKLDVGFTTVLYSYNEPFILNAPGGSFYDYTTMFHEFGHFTNAFFSESDLIFGVADNDLCELHSQGLEVLFISFYDEIFGKNSAAVRDYTLLNLVYSVLDGCMYDEFQQRVYAEEELTVRKVRDIFSQVYLDYGYEAYPGYEDEWMSVPHNFDYPFYYISYGVSALPALELYAMGQASFDRAADTYLAATALNAEDCYFSEALAEVGLGDVFDSAACRKAAAAVEASFKISGTAD